jgi:ribA/ribD-fused uncharacterized protein
MKFRGKYDFLSNFYPCSVQGYPSVENAFQAAKCVVPEHQEQFKHCSPGQAKRLGRRVKIVPNWNAVRVDVMRELVFDKFRNPELAERLVKTGSIDIVEDNLWHDNYWGRCLCRKCQLRRENQNLSAQNWLGKIIEQCRAQQHYAETF